MLWADNWDWAWMALLIAMAGFWVRVIWSMATPDRDNCAGHGYRAAAVGGAQKRRGDLCRPVRQG
jgi:hypothetical protein